MRANHTNTIGSNNQHHRRIGKKALQADRISRVLGIPVEHKSKNLLRRVNLRSRASMIAICAVLTIGAIGYAGSTFIFQQAAAAQKVQLAEQQKITRAKDEAASACRQQKAVEKADLIGKVTYDELYDQNECER